jgi:hypothetical protein
VQYSRNYKYGLDGGIKKCNQMIVRAYYRECSLDCGCVDGTSGGGLEKVQGDGGLAGGEGQGQAGLNAFSHLYNVILRLELKFSSRLSYCLKCLITPVQFS